MTRGAYRTFAGLTREQRFWAKVQKTEGCWFWLGTKTLSGYGQMRWMGKKIYTHRYSMELAGKPLLATECACHTCDNPSCVNPAHLYAGTVADNARDMSVRGRGRLRNQITHCSKGHALAPDNLYILKGSGYRRCATCCRFRATKAYRDMRRAERVV